MCIFCGNDISRTAHETIQSNLKANIDRLLDELHAKEDLVVGLQKSLDEKDVINATSPNTLERNHSTKWNSELSKHSVFSLLSRLFRDARSKQVHHSGDASDLQFDEDSFEKRLQEVESEFRTWKLDNFYDLETKVYKSSRLSESVSLSVYIEISGLEIGETLALQKYQEGCFGEIIKNEDGSTTCSIGETSIALGVYMGLERVSSGPGITFSFYATVADNTTNNEFIDLSRIETVMNRMHDVVKMERWKVLLNCKS